MVKIINLTDHNIDLLDGKGEIYHSFPPSGFVLRSDVQIEHIGDLNFLTSEGVDMSVPISNRNLSCVGMPYWKKDVYYIVSEKVKRCFPLRTDLLVPEDVVRDDKGKALGCRTLSI